MNFGMIRKARQSDARLMTDLGEAMHQESRYKKYPFDKEKLHTFISNAIDSDRYIVLVYENEDGIQGMFLGVMFAHFFGPAKKSGDLFLYVTPDFRGKHVGMQLVKKYIEIAEENGIDDIGIGNSTDVETDKVEKLYMRAGFRRVGGVFTYGET